MHTGVCLPFSRFNEEAPEVEGTGIGLTVSRQLVEAMSRSIYLYSEPSKSSVYWIDLPLINSIKNKQQKSDKENFSDVVTGGKKKLLYMKSNC